MNHHDIAREIRKHTEQMRHRSSAMVRSEHAFQANRNVDALLAIIDQQEQTIAALQSTNQALLIGALS